MERYAVVDFFGKNVLTTEFGEWKRHRKITAPAFSEVRDYRLIEDGTCVSNDWPQKNNRLALEESVRTITSLFEEEWCDKQEVVVEDTLSLTMAVSPPDADLK